MGYILLGIEVLEPVVMLRKHGFQDKCTHHDILYSTKFLGMSTIFISLVDFIIEEKQSEDESPEYGDQINGS